MKPAHWVVFNARSMRKTGCALLIGAYRKAQCAFARALAFAHRSTEAQRRAEASELLVAFQLSKCEGCDDV